jgi:hypothetical protein
MSLNNAHAINFIFDPGKFYLFNYRVVYLLSSFFYLHLKSAIMAESTTSNSDEAKEPTPLVYKNTTAPLAGTMIALELTFCLETKTVSKCSFDCSII